MADVPLPAPLMLPALYASHAGVWRLDPAQGDLINGVATRTLTRGEAMAAAADTPHLMLNAPMMAVRLGYPELSGLDLLELFAFLHPARFMVPTPKGLAHGLNLPEPEDDSAVPMLLQQAAGVLLARGHAPWPEREGVWTALPSLQRLRWPWAALLSAHIPQPARAERWLFSRLPEWEEEGERPPPAPVMLAPEAVQERLANLTGSSRQGEDRPGQRAYAMATARLFAPREAQQNPHLLLMEAGTGTGKTLGYLAPASLYAEASGGTVWISTFTKALQRQLQHESRRIWPDAPTPQRTTAPQRTIVVRKGRENYLCLLNLEDALQGGFGGRAAIFAYLVARWAAYTADGDMIGGDLPGWLATLFRQRALTALTDRRGECVYAGCPHYRKCFIERAIRASTRADLVIANHALVMIHAARRRDGDSHPSRIIFDEGHHVFDAADSTFAITLTGAEAIELRRWVIGPEKGGRGRRRGLAARLADVGSYDDAAGKAITAALLAAEALPGENWLQRLAENAPFGPLEEWLAAVRWLVLARDESGGQDAGYSLETDVTDPGEALIEQTNRARKALAKLREPLARLAARLDAMLSDPPDWLHEHEPPSPAGAGGAWAETSAISRLEGAMRALAWRLDLLTAWDALLARLSGPADPHFIDWLAVERAEGREYDIGMHRHWLDPMQPFAHTVLAPAHGVMMTSATLRDGPRTIDQTPDQTTGQAPEAENAGWDTAIARSGAVHLNLQPILASFPSPFDYARQAEVLIVTDVPKGDMAALAGAYARLIEAAGGGVLGLFTAIRRLHGVHTRIADRLARAGLPLYAQHVDPVDTGTLVDIFRDDPRASLLGTDALRDGVDVPGHSLRLVVMEQVPWPQPSILHRARRMAAGGQAHDDRIIRARLAQGFGRLIRTHTDHGHFVVLSAAFPSRLLRAFPAATAIHRVSLDEALQRISASVSEDHPHTPESGPKPAL